MRALVQRVKKGSVTIEGKVNGSIGQGLVILLGITHTDTEKDADFVADKCVDLRIFEDENGKMNKSLEETGGSILLISQFTLYAAARKGRRPSFDAAARPEYAEPLYEYFIRKLRSRGITVETGIFGADMQVEIHNDGPVTMLVEYPG
ncbi:MAG: D-tyrosyl-tRNA(Tyr) deacylase [Lentisphaerae bacterium]|nr:D-tyrosyl-tRNA(Tyr) deacylase [Lentisphaerota bacterium]